MKHAPSHGQQLSEAYLGANFSNFHQYAQGNLMRLKTDLRGFTFTSHDIISRFRFDTDTPMGIINRFRAEMLIKGVHWIKHAGGETNGSIYYTKKRWKYFHSITKKIGAGSKNTSKPTSKQ